MVSDAFRVILRKRLAKACSTATTAQCGFNNTGALIRDSDDTLGAQLKKWNIVLVLILAERTSKLG